MYPYFNIALYIFMNSNSIVKKHGDDLLVFRMPIFKRILLVKLVSHFLKMGYFCLLRCYPTENVLEFQTTNSQPNWSENSQWPTNF